MSNNVKKYNDFLELLAKELDIPPGKYQQAVERYESVGKYLESGVYTFCSTEPHIYPQGSFLLGTVVRPYKFGSDADYDIDLVCEFPCSKDNTEPRIVKNEVGDRLKSHGKYEGMLDDEGRRCWTLGYAEKDGIGFHLDVLPCAEENASQKRLLTEFSESPLYTQSAIAITHKSGSEHEWKSSNPKGYADWFKSKQRFIYEIVAPSARRALFVKHSDVFASVDSVPEALIRTPLQRVIQILKRHRDVRFSGHPQEEFKPISMIITTLSAHLYNNESDIISALTNIVKQLASHAVLLENTALIERDESSLHFIKKTPDGKWEIQNPVNTKENFADRWHEENNARAKAFFQWVSWVRRDLLDIIAQFELEKSAQVLQESFGTAVTNHVIKKLSPTTAPAVAAVAATNNQGPHIEISRPAKPWGKQ